MPSNMPVRIRNHNHLNSINFYSIKRYVISEWSSCSQSCGNSGMKTRNVTCMRFVNDTADQKISMIHCRYLAAPVMSMACNRKNCLSEWRTGAWSRVS